MMKDVSGNHYIQQYKQGNRELQEIAQASYVLLRMHYSDTNHAFVIVEALVIVCLIDVPRSEYAPRTPTFVCPPRVCPSSNWTRLPTLYDGPPLPFDEQANAASGTVGVSNSGRATTAILAPFFLCKPGRLRRRPSACNAACEEASSGQRHSHDVLPHGEAANEDGSSVIHGGLPSCLPVPSQRLPQHVRLSPWLDRL
jgi:hypothetical protein